MKYSLWKSSAFFAVFIALFSCENQKNWTHSNSENGSKKWSNYQKKVIHYQDSINAVFMSGMNGVIPSKDRGVGKSLDFFEPNDNFRAEATFKKSTNFQKIEVMTSSNDVRVYEKFGVLYFKINQTPLELTLYKSESNADYLFCPFKDFTNGKESYGAGRYLNFEIKDTLNPVIDFNYAYNPYCAYNDKYSCPIPPVENHLKIAIKAGEKAWKTIDVK
jgi:uncharacterized protein